MTYWFQRRLYISHTTLNDACYSLEQALLLADKYMKEHKPGSVETCRILSCSVDGKAVVKDYLSA